MTENVFGHLAIAVCVGFAFVIVAVGKVVQSLDGPYSPHFLIASLFMVLYGVYIAVEVFMEGGNS